MPRSAPVFLPQWPPPFRLPLKSPLTFSADHSACNGEPASATRPSLADGGRAVENQNTMIPFCTQQRQHPQTGWASHVVEPATPSSPAPARCCILVERQRCRGSTQSSCRCSKTIDGPRMLATVYGSTASPPAYDQLTILVDCVGHGSFRNAPNEPLTRHGVECAHASDTRASERASELVSRSLRDFPSARTSRAVSTTTTSGFLSLLVVLF